MTENENKFDCVTLFTAAQFSLLSGAVLCTAPTELEEIRKRYDDMVKILGNVDIVVAEYSIVPEYPQDKWPWATDYTDIANYVRNDIICNYKECNINGLDEITWMSLLSNEEIESKYRLSRVKKKVTSQLRLPF